MAQTEQFTNVVWTDDCGCYLTAKVPAAVITRCPLHAAAPAMLEALSKALMGVPALMSVIGTLRQPSDEALYEQIAETMGEARRWVDDTLSLIAQAREVPANA